MAIVTLAFMDGNHTARSSGSRVTIVDAVPLWKRATLLEIIESFVCGLFLLLVPLELIVGGLILLLAQPASNTIGLPISVAIPLLIILIIADGWVIASAWECYSNQEIPMGPAMAARHPNLPRLLRPVAAAVWLGHAILLIWVVFSMQRNLVRWSAADYGMSAMLIGMTFVANIYVMLAFSAIKRDSTAARLFWRFHIAVDVAIILGVTVAIHF